MVVGQERNEQVVVRRRHQGEASGRQAGIKEREQSLVGQVVCEQLRIGNGEGGG